MEGRSFRGPTSGKEGLEAAITTFGPKSLAARCLEIRRLMWGHPSTDVLGGWSDVIPSAVRCLDIHRLMWGHPSTDVLGGWSDVIPSAVRCLDIHRPM